MRTSVVVRHNFETAHRLYALGPGTKCWNLHGHSWWAEITVTGEPDGRGMIVEYGELKAAVRGYIDEWLDHGAVLNADDPLFAALDGQGCKVMTLSHDPTVEAIAAHLAGVIGELLPALVNGGNCWVERVVVHETYVNAAMVEQ